MIDEKDTWLEDERTATLYQVIGSLAEAAGVFDDPAVIRALDLAAYGKTEDGADVLPFAPAYESAKPKEAVGWRDIASAPEDGTEILVWGREAQVPHDRLRRIVVRYSRGWWSTTHPSMAVKAFHWRPLPEPPSAMLPAAKDAP